MAEDLVLGIDVGTTAVKLALFDASGRQRDHYREPYGIRRGPGGMAEQDPQEWIGHIQSAISRFASTHDLSGLKGIGICSQVNTHVFVDAAGKALAPAFVWQDGRCGKEAAELDAMVAEEDRIRWWGAPLPIDASHCLSRMKWMQIHRPDVWQRTRWVMLPKDYCILRLTGEIVSDPISNVGLVDGDLEYIADLVGLVDGARERLPPLAGLTEIGGTVRDGWPCAGLPVAVSTMDAWAGMFGVGVHHPGQAMYLSGTSEILGIVSPKVVPTPGIIVFPTYRDMTVHAGPTQAGGASVQWYCDTFGVTPDRMSDSVENLARGRPLPLFLPHLQGERAPIWDIGSRAAFLGIDADTAAADLARAVYTGVACSVRLLLESLEKSADTVPETLLCGGGGFRSDPWNRIRADMLGRSLKRLEVADPGVLGAAAIATVASGTHSGFEEALAEIVHYDRTYEPDRSREAWCRDVFEIYRETYSATRDLSHRLVALTSGSDA